MVLHFGEFTLDTEHYEFQHNGETCPLEPKVFDLLVQFASHPKRVFSREELIASIWNGRVVSDTAISTCIKSARKALGDNGSSQTYIKTVRGHGFRFTAEVIRTQTQQATDPSILVLPFRALADDFSLQQLAAALTHGLSSLLTRIPLLRLCAQADRYKNYRITPSAREIHEELGVDYLLEATLAPLGTQTRINVQLADAKSGFCLWAEQFTVTGSPETVLDQTVINIIAKLEPQLHRAIYNQVRSHDGEPTARQLYFEASGILALKGWHNESFTEAANLLRRSWALEPEFALAPSYLSLVLGLGDRVGLVDGDSDQIKAEALNAAERSLELDSMDSTVLGFSGCALADIGHTQRAIPIIKKAVEINPANAAAWAALGSVCIVGGKLQEGVRHLQHGINICPLDPRLSVWGTFLVLGHILTGNLDAAVQEAELACQRDDRTYLPRIMLAAAHLLRQEPEQAKLALADAYRIKPNLTPHQISLLVGEELCNHLLPFTPT